MTGNKCKGTKFYDWNEGSDYEKVPKAPKKTDQPMTDPKPVFTRKENATLAQ